MKIVGEKLESWARSELDADKKNLFARSAFNRYYYAAFLVTREMLGEYNSDWKIAAHKSIPELLVGSFRKPVKIQLQKSFKKGYISKADMEKTSHMLLSATSDLSNLLKNAYEARKVADYEPEVKISFSKGSTKIMLNSHELNSAAAWADKTSSFCSVIRKVWKDTGLA